MQDMVQFISKKIRKLYSAVEIEESVRAVNVMKWSEGSDGAIDDHRVQAECATTWRHHHHVWLGATYEHLQQ